MKMYGTLLKVRISPIASCMTRDSRGLAVSAVRWRQQEREREFSRWPGFRKCYTRAFGRMIGNHPKGGWKSADEVFEWWLHGEKGKRNEQEEVLF